VGLLLVALYNSDGASKVFRREERGASRNRWTSFWIRSIHSTLPLNTLCSIVELL